MAAPPIDPRSIDMIYEQIKSISPYYVKELDISRDKDSEIALIRTFSYFLKEIINRLNRVPDKNLIAFLDLLGLKLLPAIPARAPITFKITDGTLESVLVPKGTQIAANEIIFETEQNILATPAKLMEAYSVGYNDGNVVDAIYQSPSSVLSEQSETDFQTKLTYTVAKGASELFLDKNEELKEGDTLNIGESEYAIVSKVSEGKVTIEDELKQFYYAGTVIEKMNYFELFNGKDIQKHVLYLGHNDLFNIKGPAIIKLKIEPFIDKLVDNNVFWQYCTEDPKSNEISWKTFDEIKKDENLIVLTKKQNYPVDNFKINEIESRWIRCVVPNNDILDFDDIIEDINVTIEPYSDISPDTVFFNDVPLDLTVSNDVLKNPIYPFGKNSRIYDSFYIGCQDAFTKKKMDIKIKFDLSQCGHFDSAGILLSWEYWNGKFWNNINDIMDSTNNFTNTGEINFICPEDMEETQVNGQKNYWIRVRIVSGEFPVVPDEEVFIYYDERYPTSWIEKVSSQILAQNLKEILFENGLNAKIGGAEELKNYMESRSNGIVVMAMDVVPDTIFDNTNGSLVKYWLKNGGNLIWIGDWEFYYYGDSNGQKIEIGEEGAKLVFEIKESITTFENSYMNTNFVFEIINNLEDFTSLRPGIISEILNEKIIYEAYATDDNAEYADPVLLKIDRGSFIKFHMEFVGDNSKAIQIANELAEFTKNRFFFLDKTEPPQISRIQIGYNSSYNDLQNCISYNNLEFKNLTDVVISKNNFKPFSCLDDMHQTLYLGFDKKLEKGPISLFLSIDEYPWLSNDLPIIKWEYYNDNNEWTNFNVTEDTKGFTRSGLFEFVIPKDFKKNKKFGKELYWIRALDVKDKLKPLGDNINEFIVTEISIIPSILTLTSTKELVGNSLEAKTEQNTKVRNKWLNISPTNFRNTGLFVKRRINSQTVSDEIKSCPNNMESFNPEWNFPDSIKEKSSSPIIRGLYLNTTWSAQWETIEDQIIGSSDGTMFQRFMIKRNPIISQEIWINEYNSLIESERNEIIANKEFNVKEVYDDKQKLTEFWVNWKAIDDIFFASDDRYYELDNYSGDLKFGDGKNGKIPPIGNENIKVNYFTGGGSKGNVPVNEIKDLVSSIASIDKAYNPLPAEGGSDVETINNLMERGPKILKNRNRAITADDFEQITRDASQAVARVKCLPNFDKNGEYTPGNVTILIIPQSNEIRPKMSLQLKNQIEIYLNGHSPNTMNLQVSEPVYVGVSVEVVLEAISSDVVPNVENEAYNILNSFLNPLTGGFKNNGWDFGRMPCISDFYNILENIEDVDHVKDIKLNLKTENGQEYIITPDIKVSNQLRLYSIIFSGKHIVDVEPYKEAA